VARGHWSRQTITSTWGQSVATSSHRPSGAESAAEQWKICLSPYRSCTALAGGQRREGVLGRIIKIGQNCLMDTASSTGAGILRLRPAGGLRQRARGQGARKKFCARLALETGTANETGINRHREFPGLSHSSFETTERHRFLRAKKSFQAPGQRDAVVEAGSQLKTIAVSLFQNPPTTFALARQWSTSGIESGASHATGRLDHARQSER